MGVTRDPLCSDMKYKSQCRGVRRRLSGGRRAVNTKYEVRRQDCPKLLDETRMIRELPTDRRRKCESISHQNATYHGSEVVAKNGSEDGHL